MGAGHGDKDQVPWIMRDSSWSRVGLGVAAVLFALAPVVRRRATRVTLLTYLQLPIYMIHLYEEHRHGGFKRELNALVPPTVGHLGDRTNFLIHVPIVWGIHVAVTTLAATIAPVLGLFAPYLAVVNAMVHLVTALGKRRYNAGLGTALALFFPIGLYNIRAIGRATGATPRMHLAAASMGIGGQLLVVALLLLGRRRPQT
jgi:hypothetical protein